jgi:hypothetical protein
MSPEMENVQVPEFDDLEQPNSEAPVTEQPTPEVTPIEAGGKQFQSPQELAEAYAHAQGAMTKAQQEAAELRHVKEQWDQFAGALEQDPGLRDHIESYYQEQPTSPRPTALDPRAQEVNQLKQQVEAIRIDKEITDLQQHGFKVTPERRNEILGHIARNPAIRDVATSYKALYYEADLKAAADRATTQTADKVAQNQQSYPAPPAGATATGAKSFDDWSDNERADALLADIANADLSNLGA